MIPFDLLTCPLTNARLIEAGAGTGKTYAIAGLYVRLILEQAVPVREILVVTFTLAATAELKDRIRRKLRDALEAFTRQEGRDDFLQSLLEACPDPAARREACERLRTALRDFDEAAIFTIHGFCRRMLHEHAFESNVLFDTGLVTDQRRLKEEIIHDFWRIRFYEALPELAGYALSQGFSPAVLMSRMENMALNPGVRVLPENRPPSIDAIRKSIEDFHQAAAQLQAIWPSVRQDVRQRLQDPALKGTRYNPGIADRLVETMDVWLQTKDPQLFKYFEKMTPEALAGAVRQKAVPPEHAAFGICRTILERAGALCLQFDQYLLYLQTDLVKMLRVELPARKQKQNILYFDDLLLKLRDALESRGGEALAGAIRNQFRAALIDEFQDTDPVQYAIFHAVFGSRDHSLFLIGDPKQAIYSFRGADIFAYMQAAADVEAGYTLDQNWRSAPGLIAAVNALFSRACKPFVYEEISFRPAKAAAIAGRDIMTIRGTQATPFEWWFIPAGRFNASGKPLSKTAARPLIADAVAAEISHLVQLGRDRLALIGQKPLDEGDLAVLVRTNRESRLIQQALQALGIPSVLAGEENVFDSHEARELCGILQGIAWPGREDLVRGALVTDIMGTGADLLDRWLNDDAGWSVRLETFRHDHDLWETRGFMRMFRTLMAREDVRSRLLRFPDGERRLTNLLQLADILHQEAVACKLDGKRLLKWLANQMNPDTREVHDEHLLRLESDANAVKILTIHKSKGLEYPVVFCPFAWGTSRIDTKKTFSFHDETRNHALTLDLGSADRHVNKSSAQRERLAENCRLLYVALTRAKHRCYFIWGRINETESSAPAYLFHGNKIDGCAAPQGDLAGALEKHMQTLSDKDMLDDLARIAADSGGAIRLQELPAMQGVLPAIRPEIPEASSCRKFKGYINPSWRVASYSLLISGPSALAELPDRDAVTSDATGLESLLPFSARPRQERITGRGSDRTIFTFPGGTRSGILLHDILEAFDFTERNADRIRRLVAEKLDVYGFDRHWEQALTGMLQNVAACELAALPATEACGAMPLTLSMIPKSARLNEVEFYFPLKMLSRERLIDLFGAEEWTENSLERLTFSPVRGFMRGFIDLVFEYNGRFYLVDWKSNFLGPDIADYAPVRMRKAMQGHFYWLQSRLYAVALNRYLTLRLPDYQYQKHFGGIYYLFIRGMNPAYGPAYGVCADRPGRRFLANLSRSLIATEPVTTE